MLWVACCAALMGANADGVTTGTTGARGGDHHVAGNAWQAASANFSVRNYHTGHDARQIARHCEGWRAKLQQYWCDDESAAWAPKCVVVVHAGGSSYLAAVGAGGAQTFGSSLIQFDNQRRVSQRQIDFRGDNAHGLASVPHEMTHIVLADLLGGRQPPRWADEGMAMLADSREKQMLHERDLNQGLASRMAFRVVDLVSTDAYPHPSRMAAFYGQSASLTAFLALRDDPAKFVAFLQQSLDNGYDAALREVYGIANLGELERAWYQQRLAWRGGYHGVRLALDGGSLRGGAE
jgi:hypothetical protein